MSSNQTLAIGTPIIVGNLNSLHPKWAVYVKPGNRKSGATGKVLGFYRLETDLIAVQQDDGTQAAYEVTEVSART